jgi:hypothetical protein
LNDGQRHSRGTYLFNLTNGLLERREKAHASDPDAR